MFLYVTKRKSLICKIIIAVLLLATWGLVNIIREKNFKHASENTGEFRILISIEDNKLFLIQNNKCVKNYKIASGKKESPSPIGQWEITEKSDWGEGFGGYWLGLNVPWGKYGIHGTLNQGSVGYAVSKGCIRMFNKDIKELYGKVPIGTAVIITNGSYGPFGTGFRSLKPGKRGADVYAVQKRLKELGYYGGDLTGIYEDDLKFALYKFQQDKQLRIKYTMTKEDYIAMGLIEFE